MCVYVGEASPRGNSPFLSFQGTTSYIRQSQMVLIVANTCKIQAFTTFEKGLNGKMGFTWNRAT